MVDFFLSLILLAEQKQSSHNFLQQANSSATSAHSKSLLSNLHFRDDTKMHDSSTSRNPLLLAATLYLALLSTADAFVNPSQEAKHHPPRSILMMGYLDALSGSSGINNRGSNGGGGMGSNPPGGSGGGMGSNQPGGGGMGSNPPSTSQSEMPYSTPVTPPPPIGSSNGDYDQRRQGSEFGSTSNMDGGPSYSSYMSGRGHAATSMNGGGGLGMGDNHMHRDTRAGMHNHPNENGLSGSINSQSMNGSSMGRNGMNSGMIHGGMNGQNMPSVGGMNGSGAMSSSHQNALQNNRSGMGGGVNGQDNNMPSNHNSPQTNPYMNSNIVNNNHDSSLANLRGSNMNSIDPSTSKRNMDHRGHEMDHNRNMDMDRRPGYRNDGQPVRLFCACASAGIVFSLLCSTSNTPVLLYNVGQYCKWNIWPSLLWWWRYIFDDMSFFERVFFFIRAKLLTLV